MVVPTVCSLLLLGNLIKNYINICSLKNYKFDLTVPYSIGTLWYSSWGGRDSKQTDPCVACLLISPLISVDLLMVITAQLVTSAD